MSGVVHAVRTGLHWLHVHLAAWAALVRDRADPQLVAALVVLATFVLAALAISALLKDKDDLKEILQPYQLLPEHKEQVASRGLEVTQPILRRVADWLGGLVEARGLRPGLEHKLLRAGLPVGPGEFLLVCLIGVLVLGAFGALAGALLGGVVGVVFGCVTPFVFLQARAERRLRRFNAQLPDLLKLSASSLRAGFSLLQTLNAVTEQTDEPMHGELRLAMSRARLGEPIEEALREMSERTGSRDFDWTVTAIKIQREVGGNLAEILDTVATTMIERERLRREVRTLTAEGRISAIILAALPVALGGFIFVANPAYISLLVTTLPGEIALFGGVVLELVGGWWMRRTIQIEV